MGYLCQIRGVVSSGEDPGPMLVFIFVVTQGYVFYLLQSWTRGAIRSGEEPDRTGVIILNFIYNLYSIIQFEHHYRTIHKLISIAVILYIS